MKNVPEARHHEMTGTTRLSVTGTPKRLERPEGKMDMSEATERGKFVHFSGAILGYPLAGDGREWSAECEGNLLSPVREEQQLNCKGICRIVYHEL